MFTVYYDYRLHRYDVKDQHHKHSCKTIDDAREYVRKLRQHIIDAHVILDYIEVRNPQGQAIWAWGVGAH